MEQTTIDTCLALDKGFATGLPLAGGEMVFNYYYPVSMLSFVILARALAESEIRYVK